MISSSSSYLYVLCLFRLHLAGHVLNGNVIRPILFLVHSYHSKMNPFGK